MKYNCTQFLVDLVIKSPLLSLFFFLVSTRYSLFVLRLRSKKNIFYIDIFHFQYTNMKFVLCLSYPFLLIGLRKDPFLGCSKVYKYISSHCTKRKDLQQHILCDPMFSWDTNVIFNKYSSSKSYTYNLNKRYKFQQSVT